MFFATFHDGGESYLAYGPDRNDMAVAVTVGRKFDHELPMRFPACMGKLPYADGGSIQSAKEPAIRKTYDIPDFVSMKARAPQGACLDRLEVVLRTGDEPFHGGGLSLRLLDYWRWSGSSLMDNTARGMLAEFLVAAAIGQHQSPRVEWERYDLRTRTGVTIEVKSSAAIQTHKQSGKSPIEFGIGPRKGWDPETGQYSELACRWADLYVFCVLEGTEPLDVDRWQFYVLSRVVLDDKCEKQQTIRLAPLKNLKPLQCSYGCLKRTIETVAQELEDTR